MIWAAPKVQGNFYGRLPAGSCKPWLTLKLTLNWPRQLPYQSFLWAPENQLSHPTPAHDGSSCPKWPLWYQAPGRLPGIQVPVTPRHLPTPVPQVAHVTSEPHWAPVNLKAVSPQCLPTPAAPDTSYGSRQFSKQHSLWSPMNSEPVSPYTCLFQKPQVVFVAQIFSQVLYNSDPQLISMSAGFSGPRQPPYGLRWYP